MYWLGDINEPVTQSLKRWEKFIQVQIPKAKKPQSDYHCTMYYDSSCSEAFEERWDESTKDQSIELITQYIIVGKQGAALNFDPNPFISGWYNVPESVPHITLLVNENFESKDLGPMMKTALRND